MTALRGVAAWTGPVLVGALTTRVAAGAPDAPMLVLAAVVAPLVAILQPRGDDAPHLVSAAATAVSVTLLLAASFVPFGDAAALLGAQRWLGIVVAATVVTLPAVIPGGDRWRMAALAAGGGALVVAVVVLAGATALSPLSAWREAAARPALLFGAHSAWIAEGGGWFARRTTLTFDEGHRLVAVAPATFRVVERDGTNDVVRDWRLAAGDPLSVRPGDRVTVQAGSRVRFQAGKRVPGAAASGAAWADAGLAPFVGSVAALVTLMLGAIGLVPAAGRRGFAAPAMLLVVALAAACWGVYAVVTAPEAMLSGSLAEPFLSVPSAVPGARGLVLLVVAALLGLFIAAAGALRERLVTLAGARGSAAWLLAVAVAAVASLVPFDAWFLLMAGLGMAAATLGAPRLAGAGGARVAGWPLQAIGALAGGLVFAAVAALGPRLPAALAIVAEWPVLLAVPAAWLVVKFLR
ncbi:MAG TPA: hypothetical protein VFQ62_24245 [Methylomirabilota bacterium]|nr:hypothetical protein [Methylomirabilota bacterium]